MTKGGLKVEVKVLPHGKGLELPAYLTPGSAGMDLRAAIDEDAPIRMYAGNIEMIPTGIAIHIPAGYEGQVRPRSGLAVKHGLTLINAPGTIDSDYRGEIKCALIHLGPEPHTIYRGDRIAQLVIAPVIQVELEEVDELPESKRGEGGFGSTGT